MELSKSVADDIEESWNTERVLGEQAEGHAAELAENREDMVTNPA